MLYINISYITCVIYIRIGVLFLISIFISQLDSPFIIIFKIYIYIHTYTHTYTHLNTYKHLYISVYYPSISVGSTNVQIKH